MDSEDRVKLQQAWLLATACCTGAAGAIGGPGQFGVNPGWPVLAGVLCALVTCLDAVRRDVRPPDPARRWWSVPAVGVFRAVACLAAAGWVAWCYVYGAWFLQTFAALVVGYGVYALAWWRLFPMLEPPDQPTTRGMSQATVDAEAAAWVRRLAQVADAKGAVVTAIEPWPNVPGCYDVVGECADDGTDWMDIQGKARKLTASLRLPPGCGVEVGPGEHSGGFRIGVAGVDTLAEPVTYTDTSELTGNGPLPLGRYRDGTPAVATMRLTCSLVAAATNGGKSNFLHTLTANYVRCPDVLVWHIDLGGAGLALPWLTPWLDGQMEHPVIDWPATTVDEAIEMTEFALQVIAVRRRAYRRLMTEHNTDVVPCSPRLPQIRIILDETAEAAGVSSSPRLQANIVRIIQVGRAAGVRFDLSVLRATATNLPTDAQSQIGLRSVFNVHDDAEVGHALGWHTRLNLGRARHPGMGWLRLSLADGIREYRTPHTALPATIATIARACEARRPGLDEPSPQVPGRDAYLSRWERVVPRLGDDGEPAHERRSRAAHEPLDLGPLGQKLQIARAVQARARLASMPDRYVDQQWPDLAAQLVGEQPATEPVTDAEPPGDAKARMLELLDAAGPEGTSGHRLHQALTAEGIAVSRDTVYRWLGQTAIDGGRGVYIHPKFGRAGS